MFVIEFHTSLLGLRLDVVSCVIIRSMKRPCDKVLFLIFKCMCDENIPDRLCDKVLFLEFGYCHSLKYVRVESNNCLIL